MRMRRKKNLDIHLAECGVYYSELREDSLDLRKEEYHPIDAPSAGRKARSRFQHFLIETHLFYSKSGAVKGRLRLNLQSVFRSTTSLLWKSAKM